MQAQREINMQVQRTREWILEALLILLETIPYEKIKIAAITNKAGVARQTFYRNYKSKDDIIETYLETFFNEFIMDIKKIDCEDNDSAIPRLLFERLERESQITTRLMKANIEHLWMKHFERLERAYSDELCGDEKELSKQLYYRYSMKYQLSGAFGIMVDWLMNGMPLSAIEMGTIITELSKSFRHTEQYAPDLLQRIETLEC
ncbi:TetR/AcrR family transcriptional regulator [Paenibacillus agri]|uniref:TetR/AcrR family transcriptional regulator n=1 Tax=Paenibacillus agri TaxID=2744309 RepID=A0A850EH54_9BACL|nr:TetR/AcrR family transcriptional regulator [Paenibacillus agri]NUU60455.1 TetR/AcrR family transcriptional regulator [Paenibacillus agri]